MAIENFVNDMKIYLLVLISIPLIASTNIDCGGKSFHCLNSTHFMICVDLGGGVSATVDDFVIPCPPPTVCSGTNRFECEMPVSSTQAPTVQSIEATNEIEATTIAWEQINDFTTNLPNTDEQHLEFTPVDVGEAVTESIVIPLDVRVGNETGVPVNRTEPPVVSEPIQTPHDVGVGNKTGVVVDVTESQNVSESIFISLGVAVSNETAADVKGTESPVIPEPVDIPLDVAVGDETGLAVNETELPVVSEPTPLIVAVGNETSIRNVSERNNSNNTSSEASVINNFVNASLTETVPVYPETIHNESQVLINPTEEIKFSGDESNTKVTGSVTHNNTTEPPVISEQRVSVNKILIADNASELIGASESTVKEIIPDYLSGPVIVVNTSDLTIATESPIFNTNKSVIVNNSSTLTDVPNLQIVTESVSVLNKTANETIITPTITVSHSATNVTDFLVPAEFTTEPNTIEPHKSNFLVNVNTTEANIGNSTVPTIINELITTVSAIEQAANTIEGLYVTESTKIVNVPEVFVITDATPASIAIEPIIVSDLNDKNAAQMPIVIESTSSTELNVRNPSIITNVNTTEPPIINESDIPLLIIEPVLVTESALFLTTTEATVRLVDSNATEEYNTSITNEQGSVSESALSIQSVTNIMELNLLNELGEVESTTANEVLPNIETYRPIMNIAGIPSKTKNDAGFVINNTAEVIDNSTGSFNEIYDKATTNIVVTTAEAISKSNYSTTQVIDILTSVSPTEVTSNQNIITSVNSLYNESINLNNDIKVPNGNVSERSKIASTEVTAAKDVLQNNDKMNNTVAKGIVNIVPTIDIENVNATSPSILNESTNSTENTISLNIPKTLKQSDINETLNVITTLEERMIKNNHKNTTENIKIPFSPIIVKNTESNNKKKETQVPEIHMPTFENTDFSISEHTTNLPEPVINAGNFGNYDMSTEAQSPTTIFHDSQKQEIVDSTTITILNLIAEGSVVTSTPLDASPSTNTLEVNVKGVSVTDQLYATRYPSEEILLPANTTTSSELGIISTESTMHINAEAITSKSNLKKLPANNVQQPILDISVGEGGNKIIINSSKSGFTDSKQIITTIPVNTTGLLTNEVLMNAQNPTTVENSNGVLSAEGRVLSEINNQSLISITGDNNVPTIIVVTDEAPSSPQMINEDATVFGSMSNSSSVQKEPASIVSKQSLEIINTIKEAINGTSDSYNSPIDYELKKVVSDRPTQPGLKIPAVSTLQLQNKSASTVNDVLSYNQETINQSTLQLDVNYLIGITDNAQKVEDTGVIGEQKFVQSEINKNTLISTTLTTSYAAPDSVFDGTNGSEISSQMITPIINPLADLVLNGSTSVIKHSTAQKDVKLTNNTNEALNRTTHSADKKILTLNGKNVTPVNTDNLEIVDAGRTLSSTNNLSDLMSTLTKTEKDLTTAQPLSDDITAKVNPVNINDLEASSLTTGEVEQTLFTLENNEIQGKSKSASEAGSKLVKQITVTVPTPQNGTTPTYIEPGPQMDAYGQTGDNAKVNISSTNELNTPLLENLNHENASKLDIQKTQGKSELSSVAESTLFTQSMVPASMTQRDLIIVEGTQTTDNGQSKDNATASPTGITVLNTPLLEISKQIVANQGESTSSSVAETISVTQSTVPASMTQRHHIIVEGTQTTVTGQTKDNAAVSTVGTNALNTPPPSLENSKQVNVPKLDNQNIQGESSTVAESKSVTQSTISVSPVHKIGGGARTNFIGQTVSNTKFNTANIEEIYPTEGAANTNLHPGGLQWGSNININDFSGSRVTTSVPIFDVPIFETVTPTQTSLSLNTAQTSMKILPDLTNTAVIDTTLPTTDQSEDFNTMSTTLLEATAIKENNNEQVDNIPQHERLPSIEKEHTAVIQTSDLSTLESSFTMNENTKMSTVPSFKINIPINIASELYNNEEKADVEVNKVANKNVNDQNVETKLSGPGYSQVGSSIPSNSDVRTDATTSPSVETKITISNTTVVRRVTTESSTIATTTKVELDFKCQGRPTGRYADHHNCRKFYICSGIPQPIVGLCPYNTVFSDVRKLCTRNLSHCVRNNQFQCVFPGRFSDFSKPNVYYICVPKGQYFMRFKLQCQNGFYLNKLTVRCYKKQESSSISVSSVSIDNSQSTVEKKVEKQQEKKDKRKRKSKDEFECEKKGKFADKDNCRKYYICEKKNNSDDEFKLKAKKCDSGKVFHRKKKRCVHSSSYECS